ncbi:MAG TPA: hypothetical protein DGG95_13585 [Cytophagales bacterium]|nr:hypothetical protein [Cytophagales bacterium]
MPKIELEVLSKGTEKVTGDIKQMVNGFVSMDGVLKNLVAGFTLANIATSAITNTFKAITKALDESIKMANEESAINLSLTNSFGDLSSVISEYADVMKDKYNVDDGDIKQAAIYAKTIDVQKDKIQEVTEKALGLSKVFGVDLNAAIKVQKMLMDGNVESVGKLIPQLKGVSDASQAWAVINDKAAQGLRLLQTESDTFEGAQKRQTMAYEDMLKPLGAVIQYFERPFIDNAAKGFSAIEGALKGIQDNIVNAEDIKNIEKERDELNLLVGEITSSNVSNETRKKLLTDLSAKYPAFNELIRTEKTTNADLALKLEEVNNAYIDKLVLTKQQQEIDKAADKIAGLKLEKLKIESERNKEISSLIREYNLVSQSENMGWEEKIKLLQKTSEARSKQSTGDIYAYDQSMNKINQINKLETDSLSKQRDIDRASSVSQKLTDEKNTIIESLNINIKKMNELTANGAATADKNNNAIKESSNVLTNLYHTMETYSQNADEINRLIYSSDYMTEEATKKEALRQKEIEDEKKKKEEIIKEAKTASVAVQSLYTGSSYESATAIGTIFNAFQSTSANIANAAFNMYEKIKSGAKVTAENITGMVSDIASGVLNIAGSAVQAFAQLSKSESDAKLSALQEGLSNQISAIEEYYAQQEEIMGIAEETETERNQKQIDELTATLETTTDEKKKAKLKEQITELENANKRIELERKMNAEITAAKQKEAAEEKKIKKEAWDANRDSQVSTLWISALSGIATIWGTAMQLGPIAGPIFAGILTAAILATAGSETGAIYAQKNPYAAEGGILSGISTSGDRIPVNMNSKEVIYRDDTYQGTVKMFRDYQDGKFGMGGGIIIQTLNVYANSATELVSQLRQIEIQEASR